MTVNDSDPESDTVVVTLVEGSVEPDETTGVAVVTLPSGAIVSVSSSGQYTYDPNSQFDSLDEGEEGFDTFTYTISDGNGGTDEATVTISMPGVNDPPVAEDDDYGKVGNDAPVSDNVFGNDSDPEGDELTVTSVGGKDVGPTGTTTITLPSGAIMTIDGDTGDFTVDPNGQFDCLDHSETATVTFEYIVSDGNGGTDSAIVTLTLTGNNTAPYAEDDSKTTLPTATVSDTLTVNDSDPEGDTLVVTLVEGSVEPDETTGVAVATLPSGAIVSVSSSGQYTYDPNSQFDSLDEGEEGVDTFTYTISDGNGGTDEATVTISMAGVNDAPVAEDDDYGKVGNDAPVSDNVFGNVSDPEGDELTVTSVGGKDVGATGTTTITLPSGAIMTIDGDTGDFTVDPNGQFDSLDHSETATVTFEYIVSDGNGGTDSAIVTLTLTGNNTAPYAEDDSKTTLPTAAVSDTLTVNDSDPEGDTRGGDVGGGQCGTGRDDGRGGCNAAIGSDCERELVGTVHVRSQQSVRLARRGRGGRRHLHVHHLGRQRRHGRSHGDDLDGWRQRCAGSRGR